MPTFSTYIFDVDGTLAHTNKLIFESFRYIARKYLKKEVTDEDIIDLFGPTEDVILKDLIEENFDEARKEYFDFYTNEHGGMVEAFEELEATLKLIKENNKNLAVFTGKGKESTRITLEQLKLDHYFDLIVTGDDVENHKPAPDGLIKIAEHFNADRENLLMIGDSPHDVTASKEAGVPMAAVLWDSYAKDDIPSMNPEYMFDTISDFHEFVKSTL